MGNTEIGTLNSAPGAIPEFNLLGDEWGFVAMVHGVAISSCHYDTRQDAVRDWNRFCDQMNQLVRETPKHAWFCADGTAPEIYGDQVIGWHVCQDYTDEISSPCLCGKRCEDADKAVMAWNDFVDELEAMR